MEKSNKTKTTQGDSQKNSQSNPSGLIYWDDYNFEGQNNTVSNVKVEFNII